MAIAGMGARGGGKRGAIGVSVRKPKPLVMRRIREPDAAEAVRVVHSDVRAVPVPTVETIGPPLTVGSTVGCGTNFTMCPIAPYMVMLHI